jgi:hypothetical protein
VLAQPISCHERVHSALLSGGHVVLYGDGVNTRISNGVFTKPTLTIIWLMHHSSLDALRLRFRIWPL